MALIPISLKVEESLFVNILRALNNMPGVAHVHFDLDSLGGKRSSPPKPRALAAPAGSGGLPRPRKTRELIMNLLMQGPMTARNIKRAFAEAGFSDSGASSVLAVMTREGVTENVDRGIYQLTRSAMQAARNGAEVATPVLSAPPDTPTKKTKTKPAKKAKTKSKKKSTRTAYNKGVTTFGETAAGAIVKTMQEIGKPVNRADLASAIAAAGKEPKGIDNALSRLRNAGFIKLLKPGLYELTAKGRSVSLTPESEEAQSNAGE